MKDIVSTVWKKLFYSPYFFTIALRKRTDNDIVSDPKFTADYVIPSTYKNWAADPFLVDHNGKTYLFYEAVINEKGRIEVVEVGDDCTVSESRVVLEDGCHYSYPFIFKHEQTWYMIPESSASEEVRLYKAVDFPTKWEIVKVLLRKKLVDTTVFEQNGSLYLLTYLLCPGSERVQPQAYRMNWDEELPDLQPISWENYNGLECRGAGPVVNIGEKLIRPAQINEDQVYGNGLLFYRIFADGQEYKEENVGSLKSDRIKAKKIWFDGLHTYTRSEKYEAIDIRCRGFEAGKIFRVLWTKLHRV